MTSLPVVRTVVDLRAALEVERTAGRTIALVPTMGGLHEGHLSLVRAAREMADTVVATLFVNPAQFDRQDDFSAYPRDFEGDRRLFGETGAHLLYAPEASEIYPGGFSTRVSVPDLTNCLCGLHRPGHMDGVATVVTKLLIQSMPDFAVFGEKDYQQLLIIKRLAADLDLPVAVAGMPTIRDADGLALSSRNKFQTPDERQAAPILNAVLQDIAVAAASGETVASLLESGKDRLVEAGFQPVDYLEMRAAGDLTLLDIADRPARVFGAGYLGSVRLIDNAPVIEPP